MFFVKGYVLGDAMSHKSPIDDIWRSLDPGEVLKVLDMVTGVTIYVSSVVVADLISDRDLPKNENSQDSEVDSHIRRRYFVQEPKIEALE